jgi:hypothetical protein
MSGGQAVHQYHLWLIGHNVRGPRLEHPAHKVMLDKACGQHRCRSHMLAERCTAILVVYGGHVTTSTSPIAG